MQVNCNKTGWYSTVIDERVEFQQEPYFVGSGDKLEYKVETRKFIILLHFYAIKTHPNKEVNKEENVEPEIDLLRRALLPGNASLHLEVLTEIFQLQGFDANFKPFFSEELKSEW